MSKTRIYRQGTSLYVIGTEDVQEACRIAGITPETHQWSRTDYGHYARRKNGWTICSDIPAYRPKDAHPAVAFIGPIRRRETGEVIDGE